MKSKLFFPTIIFLSVLLSSCGNNNKKALDKYNTSVQNVEKVNEVSTEILFETTEEDFELSTEDYSNLESNYSSENYSSFESNYSPESYSDTDSTVIIGNFKLSNIVWDKSKTNSIKLHVGPNGNQLYNTYTHVINLEFENVSNQTMSFYQEDFYIKNTDGTFDDFGSNTFKNIRPGQKKDIHIVCNFCHFSDLTGCELYYKDQYVCTF